MGLQVHQISFEALNFLLTSCGVEAESYSNKNAIEENPNIQAMINYSASEVAKNKIIWTIITINYY